MAINEIAHIFKAIAFIRQDMIHILTQAWPALDPRFDTLDLQQAPTTCRLQQQFEDEQADLEWVEAEFASQQALLDRMRDNCNRWYLLLQQAEHTLAHLHQQGEWEQSELDRFQQQLQQSREGQNSYADALMWTQYHQTRLDKLGDMLAARTSTITVPEQTTSIPTDTACVKTLEVLYENLKMQVLQAGDVLRVFADASETHDSDLPSLQDLQRLTDDIRETDNYSVLMQLETQVEAYREPLEEVLALYSQLIEHAQRITQLQQQLQPLLNDVNLRSDPRAYALFKCINQEHTHLTSIIHGLRAAMVVGSISGKSETVQQLSRLVKTLDSLHQVSYVLKAQHHYIEVTSLRAIKRLERVRLFLEQVVVPEIDLQCDVNWQQRLQALPMSTDVTSISDVLAELQTNIAQLEQQQHENRLLLGQLADYTALVQQIEITHVTRARPLLQQLEDAKQQWDYQLVLEGMLENVAEVRSVLQVRLTNALEQALENMQPSLQKLQAQYTLYSEQSQTLMLDCLLQKQTERVAINAVLQQQQVIFPMLQTCLQDVTQLLNNYQQLQTRVEQSACYLAALITQARVHVSQSVLAPVVRCYEERVVPLQQQLKKTVTQLFLNQQRVTEHLNAAAATTVQLIKSNWDSERAMVDDLLRCSTRLAAYYPADSRALDVETWGDLQQHSDSMQEVIQNYLAILYVIPGDISLRAELETYCKNLNAVNGEQLQQSLLQAKTASDLAVILANPWCLHALRENNDKVKIFRAAHAVFVQRAAMSLTEQSRHVFAGLPLKELSALDNHVDSLSAYVRMTLVQQTDLTARTFYFEHWVWVAKHCQTQADYASCGAILTALSVSEIKRLRSTRAGLSDAAAKVLADLQQEYSPAQDYLALRLQWERELETQHIVPYLPAYQTVNVAQEEMLTALQTRMRDAVGTMTVSAETQVLMQLIRITKIGGDAAYSLSLQHEAKGSEAQASYALTRIGQALMQPGDAVLMTDFIDQAQTANSRALHNQKLVEAIQNQQNDKLYFSEIEILRLNQSTHQVYTETEFQHLLKSMSVNFDAETVTAIYQENQRLRYKHQLINPVLRQYIAEQWLHRRTQAPYAQQWLALQPSIEGIHDINKTIFSPVSDSDLQRLLEDIGLMGLTPDEIHAVQVANHQLREFADADTKQSRSSIHALYHFVRHHPRQAAAGVLVGGMVAKLIPLAIVVKSALVLKVAVATKLGVGATSGAKVAEKWHQHHFSRQSKQYGLGWFQQQSLRGMMNE